MAVAYSNPDKGRDFARFAVSLVKGGDPRSAFAFSAANYGEASRVTTCLKAAAAAGTTADSAWGGALSEYSTLTREFLELTRPFSVLSALPLREVPLGTRMLVETQGFSSYWVGEGAPKPLSSNALDAAELGIRKVVSTCVVTQEMLRLSLVQVESMLIQMLARAVAATANEYFLGYQGEVAGISPAGVLNAASIIPATGDPVVDLSALVDEYQGSFETAAFLMSPRTAVQLQLVGMRSAQTTFLDLTSKGGQLLGCPAITTTALATDTGGGTLVLLDAGSIMVGSGAVQVDSARSATVELLDEPTNNSAMGTATSHVSLWQTNSVALRVTRSLNWKTTAPDSVVALTGVDYSSS